MTPWLQTSAALLLTLASLTSLRLLPALPRRAQHSLTLAGLACLAASLHLVPWWTPPATLALLVIATLTTLLGLSAGAADRTPALGPGLLLGAGGALAAAFALPFPLAAAAAPWLTPWPALFLYGAGGASLGLLLHLLARLPGPAATSGGRSLRPAREAALGAGVLALLLPGLWSPSVTGGFGLLPAFDGQPLLTVVRAGPELGAGEASWLLPLDAHRLPIRVAVPLLGQPLLLALVLLAGAALLLLLLRQDDGPAPPAASITPATSPWHRAAGFLLLGAGALLLAVLGGCLLSPWLPATTLPDPTLLAQSLRDWLGPALPASWPLVVEPAPAALAALTPAGAGLDLALLLIAGIWSVRASLPLISQHKGPFDDEESVLLTHPLAERRRGFDLLLGLLALSLLLPGLLAWQQGLLPLADTASGLGLALTLGLAALARLADHTGWPRVARLLLAGTALAMLLALLAAGRGGSLPALLDTLAVF